MLRVASANYRCTMALHWEHNTWRRNLVAFCVAQLRRASRRIVYSNMGIVPWHAHILHHHVANRPPLPSARFSRAMPAWRGCRLLLARRVAGWGNRIGRRPWRWRNDGMRAKKNHGAVAEADAHWQGHCCTNRIFTQLHLSNLASRGRLGCQCLCINAWRCELKTLES